MRKRLLEAASIIGGMVLSLVPYFSQGANMTVTSWVLVGIGICLVLFGVLYGIFRSKTHTYLEMQQIVESRKEYLPKVKECLAQYIARVEYLAENDKRLYNLEEYKNVYFKNGIKGIRKYVQPNRIREAYYWELYQREKIWKDNAIYRQVKQGDDKTKALLNQIEYYIPIITDRKLRKYIQYVIKYSHMVYSLTIWFKFGNELFKPIPKISNLNLSRQESMLNLFHNVCSSAFKRIEMLSLGEDFNTA